MASGMLGRLMPGSSSRRRWGKLALLVLGLGLVGVAVARPRFGQTITHVQRRGADLFVLLDVSRSMLAEDVAPNRLERARSDILDLLKRLPGDRVGLIAFAGAPSLVVPLTTDHGFFRSQLADVGPETAPRGGSLIGDAIRKALESMDERADRDQAIVLITDGEDHDSFPEDAARLAAGRNVRVFAVGLGDSGDGARIPVHDESGNLRYVRHDGQEVWSRMDERLLKQIALTTSGAYIPARTTVYDLGGIYEDHLAGLTRGEISSEKRKRLLDRFQLFGCLGFVCLLVEMMIPDYRRRVVVDMQEAES